MRSSQSLLGIRVAVLATDGFETVELTKPMTRLRKEGADARVVSLRPGRIKGMNFLWRGKRVRVDQTLAVTRANDFDALLLPGGFVSPDVLRQSPRVLQLVREFDRAGKPIAVICHGPWVLISAGLVHGRRLTSWPGIADDVRNAGGVWLDSAVVRDRNWISSRSPLDLPAFGDAMVGLFAELAPRRAIVPVPPLRAARLLLTASALTTAILYARRRLAS
jgi:protease I